MDFFMRLLAIRNIFPGLTGTDRSWTKTLHFKWGLGFTAHFRVKAGLFRPSKVAVMLMSDLVCLLQLGEFMLMQNPLCFV